MSFYVPQYLDMVSESDLYTILNEQYFQNPKLTKLESLIGELRNTYINSGIETSINTDPLVKEISELIEDIFGFTSFQLIIEPSMFHNAYTYPISSKIDAWNYKKCVKKTNQGLQFTPIAGVNIVAHIYTGLLFDKKFTDREIVAVLLHEIGHNFSDSINNTLGIFSNVKKVLLIPAIITNPKAVSNIITGKVTDYNEYMRKNYPDLVSAFNALKTFVGSTTYVLLTFQRAFSVLPNVAASRFINVFNSAIQTAIKAPQNLIMNTIFNFFGKEDEYTSDSFAAMYGYGPDQSSALLKLERTNNYPVDDVFKDTEFGAIYFGIMVEFTDILQQLLSDNHPATAKRLLNMLDTLEKEYNKPYINAKTKKAIKKEIDDIKKLIDDEMQNKSFDGNIWRIMWNKYVFANSKKGPKDKMVNDILSKIEGLDTLK